MNVIFLSLVEYEYFNRESNLKYSFLKRLTNYFKCRSIICLRILGSPLYGPRPLLIAMLAWCGFDLCNPIVLFFPCSKIKWIGCRSIIK